MASVPEDAWVFETARNGFQYGASMVVYGPVWDAVRETGNYTLGVWTDSEFLPADMSGYLPKVGEKDLGDGAQVGGNFHAGSRLSILRWSDFAVVSRPDPQRPDDVYVIFLYKHDKSYRVHRWTNGLASDLRMTKVIHVDDVTDDEIEMLGFDPAEIPYDEGWINRLESEGVDPDSVPMTCFVLVGREGHRDTIQGETGQGRPITRSVLNDRFWKPPIPVWAWEIQTPDKRDNWLKAPPDGQNVKWKVDGSHQWRRNHGLSQAVGDAAKIEFQKTVVLNDGTFVETYVMDKEPDNAAYSIVRGGGFVIDFQGENYHSHRGRAAMNQWGIWNRRIADRTIVRVIPPVYSEENPSVGGVTTDLARSVLTWKQGPSTHPYESKLQQWQHEYRQRLNDELLELRKLMAGTETEVDEVDVTKDLEDLASQFGDLYTRREKVRREEEVPSRRRRRRRESKPCPECGNNLPFPGHADGCSLKPEPRDKTKVEKGKKSHTGDKDPDAAGPANGATKKVIREVEQDVPAVSFPVISPADWSDLGRGFKAIAWNPDYQDEGHRGELKVAWGVDHDSPDRYPALAQAYSHLCERYGVDDDNLAAKQAVEKALWRALVRLLSGKFGHFMGQLETNIPVDDKAVEDVRSNPDNEAIVYGLTMALYGIQDLERFATPILSQELGSSLATD